MTDSSYKARGNGERPVQEEDDPLMQLSHIGGFEELFSAQSTHQDTTPSDEMFAIDLERELVGELDDEFFGQDVPDVFSEQSAPQPAAPAAAAAAADNYRDSYRTASARSYASYNQGSHGYGSLTQKAQPQSTAPNYAEEAYTKADHDEHDHLVAAQEPYSYAEQGLNSALEDELALALSGHEDVLSDSNRFRQAGYQELFQAEPEFTPDYHEEPVLSASAVPAPTLEDELANLLFGDDAPVAYKAAETVYAPEAPLFDTYEDSVGSYDEHEPLETPNIDDFAAQSSIESGAYQPNPINPVYEEPAFAEEPYYAVPTQHSHDEPPQDMFFDDTSFAVETSDIELNALNQASAKFEATLSDLPDEGTLELNDENFSEAIERELSAQNYFAWEKDKVQTDASEVVSEDAADNFFSDNDFDFGIEESELSAPPAKVAENSPVFAHAIAEEERKPAPFPHYASPRSSLTTPAPDVATMSVSEAKVEQTQPLDLPEVPYYDEPENAGLSQLEAEFADVFSAINVEETQTNNDVAASADRAFEDIFRESYAEFALSNDESTSGGLIAGAATAAAAAAVATRRNVNEPTSASVSQDVFYNHWADGSAGVSASSKERPLSGGEDLGAAAAAYRERPVRGRRAMLLATAAGVLVLIGGIAYHFIGGAITSDEPVIIRSDNQPVKMQPENPGGTTVPNQDKAVYERVAGTIPQNPEQKSLVSAQEDPVDLAADEDEFGSIDEDRNDTISAISPNPGTEEEPLIVPRTVQTMVVRADGTIVPASSDSPRPVTPVAPEPEVLTPAEPTNRQPETPVRSVETQTFTPPMQPPVAPSRPAQQPANVATNAPAAAPAPGGYYIQIASQPSAELAQKSFATMGQKYANIIGGRAVDIRKAEIPNKGTYYRVRISGGTKTEANALCERLKTAGGSCFVTQ